MLSNSSEPVAKEPSPSIEKDPETLKEPEAALLANPAPTSESDQIAVAAASAAAAAAYQHAYAEAKKLYSASPPVAVAASAPPAAASATPAAASKIERAFMDWSSLNFLTGFFSMLVLIAAAQLFPISPMESYEISCGAVSLGIAVLVGGVDAMGKLTSPMYYTAAGVIVLTFFGSFTTTANANGYFGSWAAFGFASMMFMNASPFFQSMANQSLKVSKKPLGFLIMTSTVVLGASIDFCIPASDCFGYNGWAMSMSTISLILALGMLLLGTRVKDGPFLKRLAQFLVVWWTVGTLVVTFGAPFKSTGNGYFASFGALISSFAVLSSCT